jgi:cytochrome b pre-mRNA-processing protein 3
MFEGQTGMFQHIFGRRRQISEAVTEAAYAAIVAAARQPHLYSGFMIPDTPLGRFESLSAHLVLFLRRTKDAAAPLPALAQEIVDMFITDMDHSLRELGVGDAGVPKRMKKLSKMFYGRAEFYGKALDSGDAAGLAAALWRNIRPDTAQWLEAAALARHLILAENALKEESDASIARGEFGFLAASEENAP